MRRKSFTIALVALVWTMGAQARNAETSFVPGLAEIRIDTEGPRPLAGYVFYPGLPGVSAFRFGENAVRVGVDAFPNADLADGHFPLVVLSHGLMGHALNQAWLAVRLAEAGYLVASVHHPGTSAFDRDPAARNALWERPKDISRTITTMLKHPRYGNHILSDRIAVVGHSLGGYDVAALAGARLRLQDHVAYCRKNADDADCRFARMAALHAPDADKERLEGDLSDPRMKAGVTLDLGLVQAMDKDSLGDVFTPLLVIGAGRTPEVLNVETESRVFADHLPKSLSRYIERADLGHYDALGRCKPNGYTILEEEEPEFAHVCEASGEERTRHHDWMAAEVLAYFADMRWAMP